MSKCVVSELMVITHEICEHICRTLTQWPEKITSTANHPTTQLICLWDMPEARLFMTLGSRVFYYPSATSLCLRASVGKHRDAGAERRNYSCHHQWVMAVRTGNKALFVRHFSSGCNAAAKQLPPNEGFFNQVASVIGGRFVAVQCV